MANLIFEKFVVFSELAGRVRRTPIQVVTIDPAKTSAGLFSISSTLLDLSGNQQFTWKPDGFGDQFDPELVGGSPYFRTKGQWDPAMASPHHVRAGGAQRPGQMGPAMGGAAAAMGGMMAMQSQPAAGHGGVQDLTMGGAKVRTPHFTERLHQDHKLADKVGQKVETHETLEFRVPHRKKDRLVAMLEGLPPIVQGGRSVFVTLGKLGPAPEDRVSLMSADSLGGLLESGLGGGAAQGAESAAMLAVILGGGAVAAPVAIGGFVVVVGAALTIQMIKAHRENLKQQLVFCRLTTIPTAAGQKFFPWEEKFYEINGRPYVEYPNVVEGPDLAVLVQNYML